MAVVGKRACCGIPSTVDERVCEKGLEEEVGDRSGYEGESASVLIVSDLFSLVNVVCDVDFSSVSGPDCEIVESQTFSFS